MERMEEREGRRDVERRDGGRKKYLMQINGELRIPHKFLELHVTIMYLEIFNSQNVNSQFNQLICLQCNHFPLQKYLFSGSLCRHFSTIFWKVLE